MQTRDDSFTEMSKVLEAVSTLATMKHNTQDPQCNEVLTCPLPAYATKLKATSNYRDPNQMGLNLA